MLMEFFKNQDIRLLKIFTALGYNVTNTQTITVNQKQVTLTATKTYDGTMC